ncbi:MAG: DUF4145 domain-containing protein [Methanobacteriota archaeon]|nr:MAG: DUF4145 domain-containing protein [Euryarchaeota archaeon]
MGGLILARGDTPANLEKFINEASQCFAFQQYNAVVSPCRTILEVSVKDISIKYGILQEDFHKVRQLDFYKTSLNNLIEELSKFIQVKYLMPRLDWIRRKTNFMIHGNKSVTSSEAEAILKETISSVKKLLELKNV